MSEPEKQIRRRESDVVLIELTSKIVENNNSVSAGLSLMSENIEELAECQLRMENKIDDYTDTQSLTQLTTDVTELKKTMIEMSAILKKMDDIGLVSIVKNIKRFLWFIVVTVSGGALWVVLKDIVMFYIKRKIEGVVP
jgi:hypothetical protein